MLHKQYEYDLLKAADLQGIRAAFDESTIKRATYLLLGEMKDLEGLNLFAINYVWGQLVKMKERKAA